MAAAFNRKPAIRLGSRVRAFVHNKLSGSVERVEGRVEFIREDDMALVRIGPAFLHAERVSRLQVLQ